MPQPLDVALNEVRTLLLDPARLVRAVAGGRRRSGTPSWQRAEIRPVTLKSGEVLQINVHDGQRTHTRNVAVGTAPQAVDELLDEPFGNWHVQTTEQTVQLRVTKRGEAQLHREEKRVPQETGHDRTKRYLLDPADPLFTVLGASAAKRRQVEAFLRQVDAALPSGAGRASDAEQASGAEQAEHPSRAEPSSEVGVPPPLRVVDLGCGNAYLTFAAYQYLTGVRGLRVELTGVEQRASQRERNTRLAEELGHTEQVQFVAGAIIDAPTPAGGPPHVALALHACDTATDEALARAVRWRAQHILAAPCCHHEISAQLRRGAAPTPYQVLIRHGILRERFADVLTDSLRAALLRLHGYRVEVTEFVASEHTPRNVLIRAERTGAPPTQDQIDEYDSLVAAWGVSPTLARLLHR